MSVSRYQSIPSGGYWILYALAIVFLVITASSCNVTSQHSVPPYYSSKANPWDISGLRTWSDHFEGDPDEISRLFAELFRTYNLSRDKQLDILALSGGGLHGAYGAGVLAGWSESGARPQFDLVTGISVGAIIAPFAFIGPKYDAFLREIFTGISPEDPQKRSFKSNTEIGVGLLEPIRFRALLEKHATLDLLDEIAAESQNGRLLLIGTTDIEAERGVIWNISALALSNYPGKLDLFKKIIRATASFPRIFNPIKIKVEYGGKKFDELHVDGSATGRVFLYPPEISIRTLERHLGYQMKKNVYVINNGKLEPEYEALKPGLLPASKRYYRSLIKNQSIGNIQQIKSLALRDGMTFNLTSIPKEFFLKPNKYFDPKYTHPLFETGYQAGLLQNLWRNYIQ